MANSWLSQLQSQPWYPQVAQIFSNANVPAPLWEATLSSEDASLNPNTIVMDHYSDGTPAGYSYGLFQLNQNGLGAGQPIATLTSATGNAQIAANAMSAALAKLPSGSTLAAQLQAIEKAGWNGSLAQDPARQAALTSILQQSGTPAASSSQTTTSTGSSTNTGTSSTDNSDDTPDWLDQAFQFFNDVATNGAFLAFFLALLAGAFAVLASGAAETPSGRAAMGAALA